jgi:FKBP-type peptidyl-prolyl cis-trans isomerase
LFRLRFLLAAAALVVPILSGCGSDSSPATGTSTGPGTPGIATPASTVIVDYRGTLADGTVFDEATGARFALSDVIDGFRTGIAGMHVGETKTLVVPPEQGYGAMGSPPDIPPNATLTFVVTLQGVEG